MLSMTGNNSTVKCVKMKMAFLDLFFAGVIGQYKDAGMNAILVIADATALTKKVTL